MMYLPYLLYFPLTDFSFSAFWFYFSKLPTWLPFAVFAAMALPAVAQAVARNRKRDDWDRSEAYRPWRMLDDDGILFAVKDGDRRQASVPR